MYTVFKNGLLGGVWRGLGHTMSQEITNIWKWQKLTLITATCTRTMFVGVVFGGKRIENTYVDVIVSTCYQTFQS